MRATVRDAEAVEHAVAGEEVIAARIGIDRVRPDPYVAAVELRRNDTLHREIGQRQLFGHRLVNAGQQRMRCIARRQAPAVERRDARDHRRGHPANRAFDQRCGAFRYGHGDPFMRAWSAHDAPNACGGGSDRSYLQPDPVPGNRWRRTARSRRPAIESKSAFQ